MRVQEKVGKERAGGGWRAGGWRGRGRGADVDEEKVSPRPANVEQEFQKRPLISLWLFKLLCLHCSILEIIVTECYNAMVHK